MISTPGADPASEVARGAFSIITYLIKSSLITASPLQERWNTLHNTDVTKQWTTKWPYIANAIFRIVQNDSL